jgi:hypothetical protein
MANYKSPFLALPDEHMRLVGIISAHWEFLDVTIQRALAEVSMHDFARVAQFTENIPFGRKMELLMAYARPLQDAQPALWKGFTEINKDVLAAYGLRNRYVHARWKSGDIPELPSRVVTRSAGGRFNVADEPTCVCHMEDAAKAIHGTGQKLTTFFQTFGLLKT